MEFIVVLVTAPEDEAPVIARALVEERLAACANIVSGVRSIYRWEGKVEDDRESLVVIKTRKENFEALAARVRELHSYSVPEVIALPLAGGLQEYLGWLGESTER